MVWVCNTRRSTYFNVPEANRWMSSWAGEHKLGAMALLRCPWPASWTLTSFAQVRLCASHTKAALFISPSEAGVSRITPLWHAELYWGNGWRTEEVSYTPLGFIQVFYVDRMIPDQGCLLFYMYLWQNRPSSGWFITPLCSKWLCWCTCNGNCSAISCGVRWPCIMTNC